MLQQSINTHNFPSFNFCYIWTAFGWAAVSVRQTNTVCFEVQYNGAQGDKFFATSRTKWV